MAIETIFLFDNAALTDGANYHPSSSARIFQLNHTSTRRRSPNDSRSPTLLSRKATRRFCPARTSLLTGVKLGAVTEFRGNDAKPIFYAYLDSGPLGLGVQSYRGRGPLFVALRAETETLVHVSWNRDTVTTWEFYAVTGGMGSAGFEEARTHKLGLHAWSHSKLHWWFLRQNSRRWVECQGVRGSAGCQGGEWLAGLAVWAFRVRFAQLEEGLPSQAIVISSTLFGCVRLGISL
ncbi:hypothetical protein B0H66DRAFT_185523 [Apodospora peruviana]|uniref:Uncharacterized protein n=1 Tax=Apodospora peruviana TaxID=516989 RepID=A0AAE0IBM0_9PEZI|nr:hypothetical protein B0H66DRAFT_185523 [Apodospora peruviana]